MKICTKCNLEKTLEEFGTLTRSIDGKYPQCKVCKSSIDKNYYKKNQMKVKDNANKYYEFNKHNILNKRQENKNQYNVYNKEYKLINKDKIKEYNRIYKQSYREKRNKLRNERKKSDPLYKLIQNLRRRTNKVLKGKDLTKESHFFDFLGCTREDFKIHLEKQFDRNMTWDNYGLYWSVDHILPISIGQTEKEIYRLNSYTNLRPVPNDLNFSKNDKFDNSIAWQKQIRDQLLQDDIKKGMPIDTDISKYVLSEEKFTDEHRKFIERYEWLGTCGFGVRYVFTARYDGLLAGVVLIAEPNSYQFDKKLEALIQRGACASWTPVNLGSKLVSFSCKWMAKNTDKRIFVAYSDPEAGEIGTIYQACNFDYLGQTFGSDFQYKLPNGRLVGSRHFTRTSSMKKWAKELGIEWKKEWLTLSGFQNRSAIPEDIKKRLDEYAKKQYESLEKVKKEPKGKYVRLENYGKVKIKKIWTGLPYPKRKL